MDAVVVCVVCVGYDTGMSITGIRVVSNDDCSRLDVAKGIRNCLTYGLALACDAVFEDGRRALARIEELTATLGLDDTLLVLKDNLESIGKFKNVQGCALPGMDMAKMRMMVFQLHMFRMMQDAMIAEEEALG